MTPRTRTSIVGSLALLAALVTCTHGLAQEPGVPVRVTGPVTYPIDGEVSGDRVRMRASADGVDDAPLIYTYAGDRVRVLSDQGDWYKVALPRDYTMWVSERGSDGSQLVSVGIDKMAVVDATDVAVREGPGVNYETSGRLGRGRRIEIVGRQGGWLKFKFAAGDHGFISKKYVTLAGDLAPRPPVEPVLPPVEPVEPKPPVSDVVAPEVMATFMRAEAAYKTETAKSELKDWDLTEVEKLYRDVLSKTRNVSLVEQCGARLRVIELAKQQKTVPPSGRSVQELLDERERQIDTEFERKRLALLEKYKGQFPRLLAIGEMRPMANKLEPVTHKLLKDGRMTHLLYSETINLALYSGRTVGVEGTVDTNLKWPIPTIKVTGLVLNPDLLKGDGAEKPAPEDTPREPAPADETTGTEEPDDPH